MNTTETSIGSQHWWMVLRGLKYAAVIFTVPFYLSRCLYQRWTTVLPASVASILFVCHGNICRSPFAEAYFRSLLMKRGMSLTVKSAGLDTTPGKPAHSNTKTLAEQQTLSVDEHVTTQLHADLVNQSDLIVVMEIVQKHRVHSVYPASRGKVVLLGYFDPKGPLEVADPYGKPIDNFKTCFQQVARCCEKLADRLDLNVRNSGDQLPAASSKNV